jgi:hypothetical protein
MMTEMRRSLMILLMLLAALSAPGWVAPARAEDQAQSLTLETLSIQFWPEFDRQDVLVVYIGKVAGAAGPVELRFALPDGAEFVAAAYPDPAADGLLSDPNGRIEDGVFIMTTPNGSFHVEFYDPALKFDGDGRAYNFIWPGDYAVGALEWQVQVPFGVLDMTTEPASTASETGLYGLIYEKVVGGQVSAGTSAAFNFRYTKFDATLTTDRLPTPGPDQGAAPIAPTAAGSAGGIDTNTVLIAVMVLVGLGLIGGGLYFYNKNREGGDDDDRPVVVNRPPRRRGKRGASRGAPIAVPPPARPADEAGGRTVRFCTNCGTEVISPTDNFCRNCGARLG